MHVHTRGVSRERPDFVRGAERCWIDGDLIRLSSWPIGGIRPNGRRGPVPWLMDLAVLEEAMQEVYGGSFRLGDRAPLLQMTANALATGDRRRAADLASEVSFPPPEYASRLRNAGLRYLNWGPAHRRGNPPIDVESWLERKAWERKFDPNQPRVPRGHPDGGQWTDGPGSTGAQENPGEELLTEAEQEELGHLAEQARRILADTDHPAALLVLAGGPKLPKLPKNKSGALTYMAAFFKDIATYAVRHGPAAKTAVEWWIATRELLPEIVTFVIPPKPWEEIIADSNYHEFERMEDFEAAYGDAGLFHDWHHIVERNSGFSERELHNTENVVRIPRGRHWLVTSFMTRGQRSLGGISWRQWLIGKPIEEHRLVGLMALQEIGAMTE